MQSIKQGRSHYLLLSGYGKVLGCRSHDISYVLVHKHRGSGGKGGKAVESRGVGPPLNPSGHPSTRPEPDSGSHVVRGGVPIFTFLAKTSLAPEG